MCPEIDHVFCTAVVIGGMGYHLNELEHRFGVDLPAEKFIKVSQSDSSARNASSSRPLTG